MSADTQYAYRQATTFMHGIDPISKLVWLFCVSVLAILLIVPEVQLALFVYNLAAALLLTRLTPGFLWRSLRYIYLLGAMLFAMQALFVAGGEIWWQLGPFAVHERGMLIGAVAALRIINLATSSMIFLVSTSPRDLAIAASEKLKLPVRATQALFLALRFLPLLKGEYQALKDAHRIRGAGAGRSLRERWHRVRRFTVPYLFSSLRRAQVTALAMDAKAFGAYPTKTFYHRVHYSTRGKIFAAAWILLVVLGIYLLATGQLQRVGDLRMAHGGPISVTSGQLQSS